jgi:coenzyme F420-0:L-glutamate ligase/coenzyme F420-1:gamma-L-glutamate ligase
MITGEISVIPVPFAGEIRPGDDLAEKLRVTLRHQKISLQDGDILVIKHKIVSKAEGRIVQLGDVKPSRAAKDWALCANSGVDASNVDGGDSAVLLPKAPDRSAARLRSSIKKMMGVSVAIIISDSFGRPWREGLTEVAIGVAGMKPLLDYRGKNDPHGHQLRASYEAVADELACAAGLVCGKLNRTPVCIVRGFKYQPGRGSARDLIRAKQDDLFR